MIVFLYLGIYFIAGMGMLLIAGVFIGVCNQRKRCTQSVEATILEIVKPGQRDENNIKKNMKRGKCEFEYVGIMYETRYMNFRGLDRGVNEGDTIEIYINKNKPVEAVLKNKKSNMLFYGYIAAILACVGLIGLTKFQWVYTTNGDYVTEKYYREEKRKKEKERAEYIKENPLFELFTPAPIDYKMVDVNYFGVIKSVPSNFSKPIYYGNTPNLGGCEFYDKNMHEVICVIETDKYTDKNERMEYINAKINEDGDALYKGTILYEDPLKEIERKTINGIEYVIIRKSCEDAEADFKYYRYYAYWFTDKEYVFIMHRTSEEQIRQIVVNSLKSKK